MKSCFTTTSAGSGFLPMSHLHYTRFLLFCLMLLPAAQAWAAPPNYNITTTGNVLTINDLSGNGDILTVSEDGTGINFATDMVRSYSLNGVGFNTFPVTIPNLASYTSIVINAAGGADQVVVNNFTGAIPDITVNGGAGNLTFTAGLTNNAASARSINLLSDADITMVQTGTGGMPLNTTVTATGNVKIDAQGWRTNGGTFASSGVNFETTSNPLSTGGGDISFNHTGTVTVKSFGVQTTGGKFTVISATTVTIRDVGLQTGGGDFSCTATNLTIQGSGMITDGGDVTIVATATVQILDAGISTCGTLEDGVFTSQGVDFIMNGTGLNTCGGSVTITHTGNVTAIANTGGGFFSSTGQNFNCINNGINTAGGNVSLMHAGYNIVFQNSGVQTGGGTFTAQSLDITIGDGGLNTAKSGAQGGNVMLTHTGNILSKNSGIMTGGGKITAQGVNIDIMDGGVNTSRLNNPGGDVLLNGSGNVTSRNSGIQTGGGKLDIIAGGNVQVLDGGARTCASSGVGGNFTSSGVDFTMNATEISTCGGSVNLTHTGNVIVAAVTGGGTFSSTGKNFNCINSGVNTSGGTGGNVSLMHAGYNIVFQNSGVRTGGGMLTAESVDITIGDGGLNTSNSGGQGGDVMLTHTGNILSKNSGTMTGGGKFTAQGVHIDIIDGGLNTSRSGNPGGDVLLNGSGNVTSRNSGIQTGGGKLDIIAGGNVQVLDGGARTCASSGVGGNFTSSGVDFTMNAIEINTCGGSVNLMHTGNVIVAAVTGGGAFTSTGKNFNCINSGVNTSGGTGGNVSLMHAGYNIVFQNSGVRTGGGTLTAESMDITIGDGGLNTSNSGGPGGDVMLTHTGNILSKNSGTITGGGKFTAQGVHIDIIDGGLNTSRSGNPGGDVLLNGSGNVTSRNSGMNTGGGKLDIIAGGNVQLLDGGARTCASSGVGGNFTSSGVDFTMNAIEISTCGGSVNLMHTGNVIVAAVTGGGTFTSTGKNFNCINSGINTSGGTGGNVSLMHAGYNIVFQNSGVRTGGGTLTAESVDITIADGGLNTSRSGAQGGNVTLTNTGNVLIKNSGATTGGGSFSSQGVDIDITESGLTTALANNPGGDVNLNHTGNLTIKSNGVRTGGGKFDSRGINASITEGGLSTERTGVVGGNATLLHTGTLLLEHNGARTGGGTFYSEGTTATIRSLNSSYSGGLGGNVTLNHTGYNILIEQNGVITGGGTFLSMGADATIKDAGVNAQASGANGALTLQHTGNVMLLSGNGLRANGAVSVTANSLTVGAAISSSADNVMINAPNGTSPIFPIVDVTGNTLSFTAGNKLNIAINGATPGDGTTGYYSQLSVNGAIDLTGVSLMLTGTYAPVECETFTIVSNDGTDPVTGTFTGMPEGYVFTNFMGSAFTFMITYKGGDGNDVVLQVPPIICPASVTVGTDDGKCTALRNYLVTTNQNCGIFTLNQTAGLVSGSEFPKGITTNTWEATDGASLTATCSFTITVTDDEAPTITCPPTATVGTDDGKCTALYTYNVTSNDNCPTPTTVRTAGLASGSDFPKGTSTQVWKVTDDAGLTAECSFTITVEDDELPTITCPPTATVGTDDGKCTALYTYNVTSNDNCPAPTTVRTAGLASGSDFPKGTSTQVWKVTDGAGLTATCSFTITVIDNQPPVITCPANIVQTAAAGQCTAAVTYTVMASDNCSSTTTLTNGLPSGAVFPSGSSVVNWLVTDAAGNSSACSFTVTVTDNTNPSIVCPANIARTTNTGFCTAVVTYPNPTFSDNCSQAFLTRTSGLASGATFPKGITMVNWVATDVSGNTAVCGFTVTVTDGQAPTITCPASTSKNTDAGLCSAVVTYTTPFATDNCTGASATLFSGPASGTVFPKGANTIVWKATDGAGLTATCSFTVTVNDNQAPAITCPANQTKSTDPGMCTAVASYTIPTATDNCTAPTVTIQTGLASGMPFPKGITTVIWRATDAAGLTKTCSFRVTVNDTQAPAITCPANQSKTMDAGLCTAVATYNPATFTDNCTGGSVVKLSGLASGAAFPKGTSQVLFKATDAAGNQSLCSMTVTVTDAQLPVITCPGNVVVVGSTINGVCSATVNYNQPVASDNCGILSNFLESGLANGSVFPQGITTNTWRATDNNGLTATCAFTVTVGCGTNSSSEFEVRSSKLEMPTLEHGSSVNMRLAPNPATTEVQISLEGLPESGGQLTVFDAQGRVVWQQSNVLSPTTSIDVSDLPSGLYQVRLQTEHGVVTKGMVVSRL